MPADRRRSVGTIGAACGRLTQAPNWYYGWYMGDYAPPTTRGQTLLALAHALGGGQKASGSTILGDAIR
ncbi:MAG TPA: hypothetical protein VMU41_02655, partial [Candidatus Binataceae bacterium]|nr:hypothetical protein [Candidatus Binataceae bacterium]